MTCPHRALLAEARDTLCQIESGYVADLIAAIDAALAAPCDCARDAATQIALVTAPIVAILQQRGMSEAAKVVEDCGVHMMQTAAAIDKAREGDADG